MLLPYGGKIWLGCLLDLLCPVGIDDGAVRTSVQRLVAENWLVSRQMGRRREVEMPLDRIAQTQLIQAQIYAAGPLEWDNTWLMVLVAPTSPAAREAVRRGLTARGFAPLSPNLFIHPRRDWAMFKQDATENGFIDQIAGVFASSELSGRADLAGLWDIAAMRADWDEIAALVAVADRATDGEDAFASRVLLVHAVRRLVLRTPGLPAKILPADWPEADCRAAFRKVYWSLQERSKSWIEDRLVSTEGSPLAFVGEHPKRFP